MSGSALSPWAVVQEPVYYAVQAARQLGCEVPDDLYRHYETLLHCLRDRTVDQILQVELETPQFLSAIGPSVDGVTIRHDWKQIHTKMGQEHRTPVDLLFGVTATDVLQIFSDAEIRHGFEADHRDRLLRTFVTNNYRYHLQVCSLLSVSYLAVFLRLPSRGLVSVTEILPLLDLGWKVDSLIGFDAGHVGSFIAFIRS
ncbi:neuroligin-1-like [Penaeus vannamei]|uniref:neuroligin-1-like n=1 Tax=Penaeus vannamei TaxID=6689 RepID=UPI00387F9C45